MRSRRIVLFVALALVAVALPLWADQPLPPPPPGFDSVPLNLEAQAVKDTGQGDFIMAEKTSDANCVPGSRTSFTYGWQVPLVGFDKSWEVWKNTPEEPAGSVTGMGISDEPAGKRMYKDGILEWRKITRAMPSCGNGGVTYKGSWMGYISGKLVSLLVENAGSKETGQAWIDGYLDRVVAAALSAPAKPRTPKLVEPYIPAGFAVDDQTTVTQYHGAYNVTRVTAHKSNQLPKPFVSPDESDLDLLYTEVLEPSMGSLMWQWAQRDAEKDSQEPDSGQTFMGKETLEGGATIYWYKEDPLSFLPRRLRTAGGTAPSLHIYDATIIRKLEKGFVTVKITDFVGEQNLVRQCYGQ